jgi:hypothetical protein
VQGCAFGLMGNSFGIPTKIDPYNVLELQKIKQYLNIFINDAATIYKNKYIFLVTKIGCGFAGYKEYEIAHSSR